MTNTGCVLAFIDGRTTQSNARSWHGTVGCAITWPTRLVHGFLSRLTYI